MPRSAALAALLLALSLDGQAQALFKCVQEDRTVYQQEKCPEAAKESTIKSPDPIPPPTDHDLKRKAKAEADKAERMPQLPMEAVIDVVTGYSVCAGAVPDFEAKHGAAFEQWRQRNALSFARFEENNEARKKSVDRVVGERNKLRDDAKGRAARDEFCARTIAALGETRSAAPQPPQKN